VTVAEPTREANPKEPSPAAGAVLYAKDMRRVARFYAGLTGLTVVRTDDDHVLLESGSFQLVVLSIPKNLAASITIEDPPRRRTDTAVKLVFVVPDLAAARAAAAGLGGGLNPVDRQWRFDDTIVCDGVDPEGNVVQFRQPATTEPLPVERP
jgi:predicted enzyme related to lactoylglutathione lyase